MLQPKVRQQPRASPSAPPPAAGLTPPRVHVVYAGAGRAVVVETRKRLAQRDVDSRDRSHLLKCQAPSPYMWG